MTVRSPKKNSAMQEKRIADLKTKIQDELYVNSAIDRIAMVVSRQIVETSNNSVTGNSASYL